MPQSVTLACDFDQLCLLQEATEDAGSCRNVRIESPPGMEPSTQIKEAIIRDGVIVIPKETTLANGWSLAE